jgi:predicted MFS family arabinose efflux permease
MTETDMQSRESLSAESLPRAARIARRILFRKVESLSTSGFYLSVFLPFALGHFLSYVLRTINAILAPTLISELHLSASQIGILTSAYFLAFALGQLPVGLALDRYGPRRVQFTLLCFAALGCLWFSIANNLIELIAARALTGFGLAASFMGSLKAVSDWRPASRMPSMNGYLLAIGGLGAIASTVPAQVAVDAFGWRGIFLAIAVALVITALVIGTITPEPMDRPRRASTSFRSLVEVYRNRAFRRTIAVTLVPHITYFAVQGLWLGTWLDQVASLEPHATATYLLAGMIAMVVGTILVGRVTEWATAHGYKALDVAAIGLWFFAIIQAGLVLNGRPLAAAISIGFPLFGAFAGLEFAIVAQSVPSSLTGRASTCLNLLVFTGSFLVQAGFGALLNILGDNFQGTYPPIAFQTAFGVLLFIQLPGLSFWAIDKARRLRPSRETQSM